MFTIDQLIPSIEEDDKDIVVAMINGFQGQDIDDTPVFKDMQHLLDAAHEAGASAWLDGYIETYQ